MERLPPRAATVFRGYLVLIYSVYCALIVLLSVTGFLPCAFSAFFSVAGFWVFCVFYFSLIKKYVASWGYSIAKGSITVEKGYCLTSVKTIPIDGISHADIFENPLQKRFSLCTLGIFCPGLGVVRIPQLRRLRGMEIRGEICKEICYKSKAKDSR